ncbi:RcnB family protein [Sphingobium sp. BYY-5]|uniref:RcnB family protein n=1 Tax=Sphingobium sp. BYY-5 TaxID=2926400 RepID=UPI001FA7966D|nr:RcnB family protein [Sphingobium sp. BYY-5]MCI4589015.1 RcnB family protein [Sphingobium sp. BYY-5]
MRMPALVLMGATLALAGAASPAFAGGNPGPRVSAANDMHRWGPRQNGRWYAGWRAPGGWAGYRRPVYGFILPRYWISPSYYIANYGAYGLPVPASGYGWSRYYDDAVMTDRYGRVYDYRNDIDWGRYEGGYDAPRRDNGVGGAAIGAVVGGVAGNRIAGRGNRTAGTLIGAGVGAVAGMAIDKAEDARRDAPSPRRPGVGYDDGYGYADDIVTSANEYEGRWTGTWTTDDGRKVSGTYDGRFEGEVRGAGVDYDAPPYAIAPHWGAGPVPMGGYSAGGYYYPAPIVTTVTVQPAVTTTTTTTYVTERVAYRTPVRKVRRACRCK